VPRWSVAISLARSFGSYLLAFQDGESKGLPYLDWNTWEMVDPNVGNVGYNDGIVTAADIKPFLPFWAQYGRRLERRTRQKQVLIQRKRME
jgi:hypothetical protein